MSLNLNRRSLLVGACALALIAVAAGTQLTHLTATAAGAKPEIGTWGFDLSAMDKSVKPGDDFFRYAGGTWMKNTQIPADRSRWGSFNILGAKSEEDVRTAIDEAAQAERAGLGRAEGRRLLRSYVDTTTIEARGLEPAKADLARIAAPQDA